MAAIVSGNSLGLGLTSLKALMQSFGGAARTGVGKEQSYVNVGVEGEIPFGNQGLARFVISTQACDEPKVLRDCGMRSVRLLEVNQDGFSLIQAFGM
ncbi:MAG: hypothetical protein WAN92_04490 [Herbaspirillum sp.]